MNALTTTARIVPALGISAEDLIAQLGAIIAAADAPEGVTYSVEDDGDRIQLAACYSDALVYEDQPWVALGDLPAGGRSGMHADDQGLVSQTVAYEVEEIDGEDLEDTATARIVPALGISAEDLIAQLHAIVAAADAPEGVTYAVEDEGDRIQLVACYADDLAYEDQPWVALGDLPAGGRSGMSGDDHGLVSQTVAYEVEEID